jgi:hypothetical protein
MPTNVEELDMRIENIQDSKNDKYMIMIGIMCVSTILYIVPFSLCIIDIATNNRFGSYTIIIITSIYILMNLINVLLYIRLARHYNEKIKEYTARRWGDRGYRGIRGNDHIIINMPHKISGSPK